MQPSRSRARAALIVASAAILATATGLVTASLPASAATVNSYTAYQTTVNGGEPSIGFDVARNAAIYGETATARLTWNDSTTPATMTVTDVTPATASLTSLDPITFVDQRT